MVACNDTRRLRSRATTIAFNAIIDSNCKNRVNSKIRKYCNSAPGDSNVTRLFTFGAVIGRESGDPASSWERVIVIARDSASLIMHKRDDLGPGNQRRSAIVFEDCVPVFLSNKSCDIIVWHVFFFNRIAFGVVIGWGPREPRLEPCNYIPHLTLNAIQLLSPEISFLQHDCPIQPSSSVETRTTRRRLKTDFSDCAIRASETYLRHVT